MNAKSTPEVSTVLPGLAQAARRRRRPSERNLKIYEQVHVIGNDQSALAAEHGISQPRISAICRQVQRWLSARSPAVRGEPQAAGRQRAEAQWMRMAMRATDRLWELGELEEPQCDGLAQVGSFCREEPELYAVPKATPSSARQAEPTLAEPTDARCKCYAPEPDNSAAEAVIMETDGRRK
jgi:hypothetical protein